MSAPELLPVNSGHPSVCISSFHTDFIYLFLRQFERWIEIIASLMYFCNLSVEFEPVLSASFWSLPHEWTSTDLSLAYASPRSVECYDEQLGDKCMTLLLGTWYKKKKCLNYKPPPPKKNNAFEITKVLINSKERRRDAVHRHEGLQGHDDAVRVSSLLPVSPAALLHDRQHGNEAARVHSIETMIMN